MYWFFLFYTLFVWSCSLLFRLLAQIIVILISSSFTRCDLFYVPNIYGMWFESIVNSVYLYK